MSLSKRAQKALEILKEGGQFYHRLETNSYTRREQFKHRLFTKSSTVPVPGIGHSTFHELDATGCLTLAGGGTSVSTYYRLRTEAVS